MYTLLLTLQQSSFFRVNSFIWGLRSLMTNEANKVLYIQRRLQKGVTSTTRVPQKCPWNWSSAISGGKEDTGLDSSSVSSPPVSQISRPRPPFMTALLVLAVSGTMITILVLSCPSSPKEKLHQQLQMIRIHYYACVIGNGRTDNICYGKRAYFQHLGVAFKTRFCLRDGAAVLWVFPARIGNKSGENCSDDGPPSFAFCPRAAIPAIQQQRRSRFVYSQRPTELCPMHDLESEDLMGKLYRLTGESSPKESHL